MFRALRGHGSGKKARKYKFLNILKRYRLRSQYMPFAKLLPVH